MDRLSLSAVAMGPVPPIVWTFWPSLTLRGLGFKDHGAGGNAIDASDRDNAINLCTWTNLFGM
jgi:hypothetical protein